jgi:zinc protease
MSARSISRVSPYFLAFTLVSAALCGAQRPDTSTIAYDVGGVHVIQRTTPFAVLVSVNIYLIGGTQQLTPATAGIELLTLDAAARGTRHYPAAASAIAFQRTGSIPRLQVLPDWTVYGFVALPDQFDSSWAVFADRLVAPTLDSASVATSITKLRLEARRRRATPEGLVRETADSIVLAGHPYALAPAGTDESLGKITVAQVQQFAATQFVASRLLLVVVGPIDRPHVEQAVSATLATLPRGAYHWTPPPPFPKHDRPTLTTLPRPFTTNYLFAYFYGPPVSSGDYAPFLMASNLLGRRLGLLASRQNGRSSVRDETPTLTYALGSGLSANAIARGSIYGMVDSPNLVMPIIRSSIRDEPIFGPSYSFDRWREEYRTTFEKSQEASGAQADKLARAQIYRGDYRQETAELETIEHVTPAQIQAAAAFYMRRLQFVYAGDPKDLDPNELDAF